MTEKEKFVEEIVQSEYEDAVHTNFKVPMETVVKRVAEQAWDAGVASVKKKSQKEDEDYQLYLKLKERFEGGK